MKRNLCKYNIFVTDMELSLVLVVYTGNAESSGILIA